MDSGRGHRAGKREVTSDTVAKAVCTSGGRHMQLLAGLAGRGSRQQRLRSMLEGELKARTGGDRCHNVPVEVTNIMERISTRLLILEDVILLSHWPTM